MIRDKFLDISRIVKDKKILKLFRTVEAYGGALRFVGGAVRDAIAKIEGFDIDLATDLSPDELVEACDEKGLKTVPIGIKFGTVGVIVEGTLYEVTSLRRDVQTDGRHAVVEFTDNWEVDASRRDLTINAVYADEKGNVFDYYNGIEDLEKGIVRFIGNPEARIKEDYLRILRFFRFNSIFGQGEIDSKALKACISNKDGLKTLSAERIYSEFKKILLTPNVIKTLRVMFESEILSVVLPKSKNLSDLEFLISLTQDNIRPHEDIRRIFALYFPDQKLAENLAMRLRFTKKQKDMFIDLANTKLDIEDFMNEKSLAKIVYEHGKDFCINSLLLNLAAAKKSPNNLEALLKKIESFVVPIFPVRGGDLINAGFKDQQKIGKALKEAEQDWIESDFSLTRDEIIALALQK